jgi:hypothetical protein
MPTADRRLRLDSAVLWASAFVVAALILVTASRLPSNAAYAEMANTGLGGYSMVTAPSGNGSYEVLYVVDSQTGSFYVYTIENAADRRLTLRNGTSLPGLFRAGRGG